MRNALGFPATPIEVNPRWASLDICILPKTCCLLEVLNDEDGAGSGDEHMEEASSCKYRQDSTGTL